MLQSFFQETLFYKTLPFASLYSYSYHAWRSCSCADLIRWVQLRVDISRKYQVIENIDCHFQFCVCLAKPIIVSLPLIDARGVIKRSIKSPDDRQNKIPNEITASNGLIEFPSFITFNSDVCPPLHKQLARYVLVSFIKLNVFTARGCTA